MFNDLFVINPITGLLLTLGCYWFGVFLFQRTKLTFLQPVLTSSIVIILFLSFSGVPYEVYYNQNAVLNYILPITAVVLAVPLYRNLKILKQHALPILAGIFSGTIVTMLVVVIVCKLLGNDMSILTSMLPKSATNPIAIEISALVGGIPSLTVSMVVVTGILGGVCGPELLKLMRIKHSVAKGIALGTISHAVGTARAFKENEVEGSMSSLAMAVAGVLTALLTPVFLYFL